MKKTEASVCVSFTQEYKSSKETHSFFKKQKGLLLPFKRKQTEYERIKKILSSAADYTLGPLFIKDDQMWVTFYEGSRRHIGHNLAEEEDLLKKRLARKLANYCITVRIEVR
ncbi:hypothetical protein JOC77_000067 [Peribacillus deserti]|uniref:Uncharacterized protein n=1 Tax=Peribacillus deserti TaxID=673318 RepID=A0ABS2QDB2_9BACI|nr:hypothetical protein [Peribacillus deserti]MBM7690664.1 hypothetical protein [Peribacillus deserti]